MTHWIYAETPYGNIVYQASTRDDDAPSISLHGVGTLTAETALTTDYQGDTVPNWDAMKAEARRLAEEAGSPLPRWYAPNPPLTINGKEYTDSLWCEFRNDANGEPWIYFRMGDLTDAAKRKLGAWLIENREALIGGENGRASAIAAARDTLRWAQDAADKARKTLDEANAAENEAATKLAALLDGEA